MLQIDESITGMSYWQVLAMSFFIPHLRVRSLSVRSDHIHS